MRRHRVFVPERGEQGFTLIEALIAMVILVVGIAAIANLMVVAGTSNTVANHSTAAAAIAAEQMELLKSASFPTLVAGGTVVIPPGPHVAGHPACNTGAVTAVYVCDARVQGVGTVHVQWQIIGPPLGAATTTLFIQLVAQPVAPGIGLRGRAAFTTFRTSN